jgi:photosystem II stability/assembly factor-like uncharacterized protein
VTLSHDNDFMKGIQAMRRITGYLMSSAPLIVIAALLYAGFFIKPTPAVGKVKQPIFERGDAFYGVTIAGTHGPIWAVGSDGKIVRSDDDEVSWRLQSSPTRATLQDISAWNAEHVVAVGDQGVVLVSQDGGRSWRDVAVPHSRIADKLIRVTTLADGQAWAVGEGGSVLRSTDFGQTWVQTGVQEDTSWNDIAFQSDQAWLVGEFGRIKRSTDKGTTWHEVSSPIKTSLMAVTFKDSMNGVAVGLNGTVLITHDGGGAWTKADNVTPEHLFDVLWDGARWIAIGDKGAVVLGDAAGDRWKAARISADDRGWYTKLVAGKSRYYLAGSKLANVSEGRL